MPQGTGMRLRSSRLMTLSWKFGQTLARYPRSNNASNNPASQKSAVVPVGRGGMCIVVPDWSQVTKESRMNATQKIN